MAEADPSIFAQMKPVEVREAADFAALSALLDEASAPFVVRGLVNDWPLVAAGRDSPRAARSYLLDKAHPVPFEVTIGQPGRDGRLFYEDDFAMNFRQARGKLADIFRGFLADDLDDVVHRDDADEAAGLVDHGSRDEVVFAELEGDVFLVHLDRDQRLLGFHDLGNLDRTLGAHHA